jgi:hypothetical protein
MEASEPGRTNVKAVLSSPCGDIVSDSRLQAIILPRLVWLRRLFPANWFGALVLFFLPWWDISCINDRGTVTRFTISGAQFVWGGATTHSKRPEGVDAKAEEGKVTVEVAPNAIKEEPKRVVGRLVLAAYGLLLIACLSFALIQPSLGRALAGFYLSLILLALLLTGSWLLLGDPFFPDNPSRMFNRWLLTSIYTPWYYASYLANIAALLCFGIEWWFMRRKGTG